MFAAAQLTAWQGIAFTVVVIGGLGLMMMLGIYLAGKK